MNEGDRVRVIRSDSVEHFRGAPGGPMPVTGTIIEINDENYEGVYPRPVFVKFDDERTGWWGFWELKRIYK